MILFKRFLGTYGIILSIITIPAFAQEDFPSPGDFVKVDQAASFDWHKLYDKVVYPRAAAENAMEGQSVVQALIDKEGYPVRYRILSSAGPILDSSAVTAVRSIRYEPAEYDGDPVSMWIAIPITFRMRGPFSKLTNNEHLFRNLDVMMRIDSVNTADYLYQRGLEYFKKGDYAHARGDYQKSQGIRWNGMRKYYEQDFLSDVDQNTDTTSADSLLTRATRFKNKYLFLYALRDLDRALSLKPAFTAAYHEKSYVYARMDMADSIIKVLLEAVSVDANDTLALGNLGWYYYEKGDYEKSLFYSEKALKLDPKRLNVRYNIPLAHLRYGNFEKALESYEDAYDYNMEMNVATYYGAIGDLRELIRLGVKEKEAREILKDVFYVYD